MERGVMDDRARIRHGQMLRSQYARMRSNPESEIAWPTLAHVPGVEVTGRYRTQHLRLKLEARRAILRPRLLFIGPRRQAQLVHLGGGRTLFH
jgi:hypothetical protein